MEAINQARNRYKVLEALMDWVEDMLADRNLTISHGDTTIEDKPDKGCAQGVVLSPLLWCHGKRPPRGSTTSVKYKKSFNP
jgi:hypothetical protein